MYYSAIAFTLALFWLLLSGHSEPLLLGAGALSVVLVLWLYRRMDRIDRVRGFLPLRWRLVDFGGWLLWSVVRSNLDVARRIWSPSLPIRPCWRRLDSDLVSGLAKTLYANGITLTPGTLTTDVRDGYLVVHCLVPSAFSALADGAMERRIQRLEL